ncbi:CoA transferase [Variovorax saccharolyticus]|uniref:CoA transferase n=1 Tax=Variovorax saccharolyticus TaxID=3053516 RepID=UPI00336C0B2F
MQGAPPAGRARAGNEASTHRAGFGHCRNYSGTWFGLSAPAKTPQAVRAGHRGHRRSATQIRSPARARHQQRAHRHRPRLPKTIGERFARRGAYELAQAMENARLPFAPNRRPQDLYDDEHLRATGDIADMRVSDGPRADETVETVLFPITLERQRLGVRLSSPRLGEHTAEPARTTGLRP